MNYWSKAKDVLTILIIPLVLWGVKLEVTIAVQEERLHELRREIEASVERKGSMADTIQSNSIQLASLSAKLDAANERLSTIKDMLTR